MPGLKTIPETTDVSFKSCQGRGLIPLLICCGLVALMLWAFWPLTLCGFINYDDPDYVTENPHVQAGITWATVKWAFTSIEASNWHPITWLSHALDWQLFGGNAPIHHLVSLGIHIANSLLIFWVFRALTGALWRPAILAALFAVHPAHVESVAWVSERKDMLSTFFFLLTVEAYGKYVASIRGQAGGKVQDRSSSIATSAWSVVTSRGGLWYLVALGLFALGLMSKPMLVTLPFVLLLLDYWPLKRFSSPHSPLRTTDYGLRRLLLEKVPFILLSGASCAITMFAQSRGGAVKNALPFLARLENAAVACIRYLGLAIWPTKLSIVYPHPGQWPVGLAVICGCGVILLSALAFLLKGRFPWVFVGWFWFVGMLVPVVGLVQVGFQAIADRYTYLPFVGLFMMAVWGAVEGLEWPNSKLQTSSTRDASNPKLSKRTSFGPSTAQRTLHAAMSIGIVLLCVTMTRRDVGYWRDSGTLFTHAIAVTRDNFLVHDHLGIFLAAGGHSAEAIGHYQESLRINPGFGETHNNLGVELARAGEIKKAEAHFQQAIELNPKLPAAYNNLGLVLAGSGRASEAIREFETSLRLKEDGRVHLNLARAYCTVGRFSDGVAEYQTAIRTGVGSVDVRVESAGALGETGKRNEARRECQQVLKLSPGYKPAQDLIKALDARR